MNRIERIIRCTASDVTGKMIDEVSMYQLTSEQASQIISQSMQKVGLSLDKEEEFKIRLKEQHSPSMTDIACLLQVMLDELKEEAKTESKGVTASE